MPKEKRWALWGLTAKRAGAREVTRWQVRQDQDHQWVCSARTITHAQEKRSLQYRRERLIKTPKNLLIVRHFFLPLQVIILKTFPWFLALTVYTLKHKKKSTIHKVSITRGSVFQPIISKNPLKHHLVLLSKEETIRLWKTATQLPLIAVLILARTA